MSTSMDPAELECRLVLATTSDGGREPIDRYGRQLPPLTLAAMT